MTERGPLPYPEPAGNENQWDMTPRPDQTADWGRDQLAEVLDSHPHHTRDIAWGDGTVYLVGDAPDDATRLEVFPTAGVARITGRDVEITLFRQPPPSRYTDRVRFERVDPDEHLELTLTRRGRLRLDVTSLPGDDHGASTTADDRETRLSTQPSLGTYPDAPETVVDVQPTPVENSPESHVSSADGTVIPHDAETPVIGDSGGAGGHGREPSERPENDQVEPTPTRLNLTGRLGRPPSFRTTRNGKLIASFPLAVRDDEGNTTWHTVLAFGERAEKLRDQLAKGQHVDVIGYRHEREVRNKRGGSRTIEEIYATVIKPR